MLGTMPGHRAFALAALLAASATAARADEVTGPELRTLGEGEVREKSARITVDIDGLLARVTLASELVAAEGPDAEARLTFALPRDAIPVAVEVKDGAKTLTSIGVDADSAVGAIRDPGGLKQRPDVALLRRVAWPSRYRAEQTVGWTRWELSLFPVTARGTTVRVTWLVPVRYDDARLEVRLPGHAGPRLADPTVDLVIDGPPGTRSLGDVACAGRTVAKSAAAHARFTCGPLHGKELVVTAVPTFVDDRPRVRIAHAPLDAATTVLGVEVVVPPALRRKGARWERAVILVDTSRSLGDAGARTSRDLVRAALASLPSSTTVEVISFDRTATSILGGLVKSTAAARTKVDATLKARRPKNGSDLVAALRAAGRLLADAERRAPSPKGGDPTTLLLVVSDGLTPTTVSADEALSALGEPITATTHVAVILVHPEGTPAPPASALALGQLAARVGGQTLLLPDLIAPARIAATVAAIDRPLPLSTPELELGAAIVEGLELPSQIAPGSGITATGRVRGPLPSSVTITGRRRTQTVSLQSAPASAAFVKAIAATWLAARTAEDFVGPADRLDPSSTYAADVWEAARRALVTLSARVGLASEDVALVVIDPADPFGALRLDAVRRFGPTVFQRLQPPPERVAGRELVAQVRASSTPRASDPAPLIPPRGLATGELDLPIIRRVVRGALLPLAKTCYDQTLRGAPTFGGSVELRLELSRGELTGVTITRSTVTGTRGAALETCVRDAAQGIDVPRVAVGDLPDDITIARYPLTFRVIGGNADVVDERTTPAAAKGDPLEGLGN